VLRQALRASGAALALGALLDEVLEFALTSLHAERGNVQLADPATGALTIAAQRGFGPEFAEYFAAVTDDGSACGRAARHHAQVVITDVTTDPGFAPHREIALASGFRAVQSTPLVNRAGYLVGMLSTHYPRPTTPPLRDLQAISRFGALAGERLSTLLNRTQADGFVKAWPSAADAIQPPAPDIPGHMHTKPAHTGQQYEKGPRGKDRLADAHHDPDHRRHHHLPRFLAAPQVRARRGLLPRTRNPVPGGPGHSPRAACAHPRRQCRGIGPRAWSPAAPGSCPATTGPQAP
jgi:GAF domain-containing protein